MLHVNFIYENKTNKLPFLFVIITILTYHIEKKVALCEPVKKHEYSTSDKKCCFSTCRVISKERSFVNTNVSLEY